MPGYRQYFAEAFGSEEITKERVAQAIADYERTRMSGNSPYDRWRRTRDATAVSAEVKLGHELFFGKAGCVQCHVGSSFTDNKFHNIGVGWDDTTRAFADEGRYVVTKGTVNESFGAADRGAFKTPTLREVTKHAPVHARRLGGDAARGRRALQPRRQQEPLPRPEDARSRSA